MEKFDVALGLALFVSIVLTAQIVNLVADAGFETLRYVVWILGYGGAVVVGWYVWIRPLDIRAPARDDETVWGTDDTESSDPER
jgi:hypothetical protein